MEGDGTSPRSGRRFVPWPLSENALRSRLDDVLVDTEHFFFFAATRATAACSSEKFSCCDNWLQPSPESPSNGEELRSSANDVRVWFSVGSRSRGRMLLERGS